MFMQKKLVVYAIKTSESFGISQSICTRTFRNLTMYLRRNSPEPHQVSSPPLHRNLPEPHKVSAPEPSGTSQGICTGTLRKRTEPSGASAGTFTGTLRNLTRYLHRNPPEPQQVPSPEPSKTLRGICTGTLRKRTEPSGASAGTFTGTLRNLTRYLHRNPPEPHEVSAPEPSGTLSGTWCWSCTGSHRS